MTTVNDLNGMPGDNVTVVIDVIDENGNLVTDGSVNVYINGSYYGNFNVANGKVIFNYTISKDIAMNTVLPVTAVYLANGKYNGSEGSGTISVRYQTFITITNVDDLSGYPGDNRTIIVQVNATKSDANPVNGGELIITLNGTVLGHGIVVNGVLAINFTLPDAGIYNLIAYYNGTSYYAPSNDSAIVTVYPWNTTISVDNISGHPGDNVDISVNITDENGNPILNGTLSTVIGGVTYDANIVNGTAIFTNVTLPDTGDYNFTVNYNGTTNYLPSNGLGNLNTTKLNLNITVPNISGNPGDNVTVIINVTDENGNSVDGVNITVTLPNGTNLTVPVVNGSANVNFTLPDAGDYNFTINFNGSDVYNSANGSSLIHVNNSPDPQPDPKPDPSPSPKPEYKPNHKYYPVHNPINPHNGNYGIFSNLEDNSVNNGSNLKNSSNGLAMKSTGNPLVVLLLALLVLPFIRRKN